MFYILPLEYSCFKKANQEGNEKEMWKASLSESRFLRKGSKGLRNTLVSFKLFHHNLSGNWRLRRCPHAGAWGLYEGRRL